MWTISLHLLTTRLAQCKPAQALEKSRTEETERVLFSSIFLVFENQTYH